MALYGGSRRIRKESINVNAPTHIYPRRNSLHYPAEQLRAVNASAPEIISGASGTVRCVRWVRGQDITGRFQRAEQVAQDEFNVCYRIEGGIESGEFNCPGVDVCTDHLVRAAYLQACQVHPKCARAVVILAMNVIG